MELTPESIANVEFVERRRGGYDIAQVDDFLEKAGNEFARVLFKAEKADERVAAAETRASEAEKRAKQLEEIVADLRKQLATARDGADAPKEPSSEAGPPSREEQVGNVARALIIAQEAADQALQEARNEAQSIVEAARERSEQQLADTTKKIDALVVEGKARADREYATRREEALAAVVELESRRAALSEIISRLEARLAGYREDLRRAAVELTAIADDPSLIGERADSEALGHETSAAAPAATDGPVVEEAGTAPEESPVAAEVVADTEITEGAGGASSADGTEDGDDGAATAADEPAAASAPGEQEVLELDLAASEAAAGEAGAAQRADDATADGEVDDPAEFVDLRSSNEEPADEAAAGEEWEPGSWSRLAAELPDDDDGPDETRVVAAPKDVALATSPATGMDQPTEAIDKVELIRDRYLEDLAQAVNTDLDGDDEAFSSFFEGTSDAKARRFGWRR